MTSWEIKAGEGVFWLEGGGVIKDGASKGEGISRRKFMASARVGVERGK